MSIYDELIGKELELFEVIASKSHFIGSVSEPAYIVLDFPYELVSFLVGIGVVVAQETGSAHPYCWLKVDPDRFDVPNV